jgi:hypothetical protein
VIILDQATLVKEAKNREAKASACGQVMVAELPRGVDLRAVGAIRVVTPSALEVERVLAAAAYRPVIPTEIVTSVQASQVI